MKGRSRKPIQLLELTGATRKNPQRYRERKASASGIAAGLGPPPAEWVEKSETHDRCRQLLQIWNEIVAQDVLRVLNVSHRVLVENTCHLMYKIRRASAGYGKATSGDFAQVANNLAKMGMTPADSSRVAEAVRVPERGGTQRSQSGGWGELVG